MLLQANQGRVIPGDGEDGRRCAAEGGDVPPTPFGQRMALNIQHLLRLEAGLDQYADPAAGSYYLETLTKQLVDAAWERFRAVEVQGGFAVAMDL